MKDTFNHLRERLNNSLRRAFLKAGLAPPAYKRKAKFFEAIKRNDADAVRALLQEHPELINARLRLKVISKGKTSFEYIPLLNFVIRRVGGPEEVEVVKTLTSLFPGLLTEKDEKGRTPLHRYIEAKSSVYYIDLLCEMGAGVNTPDNTGATPLHYAAKDLLRAELNGKSLLKNGAWPDARDENGRTPLMYAARSSSAEGFIAAVIGAGADIHATDNEGLTATTYAIRAKAPWTVLALLRHGGKADFNDPATADFLEWVGPRPMAGALRELFSAQKEAFDKVAVGAMVDETSNGLAQTVTVKPLRYRQRDQGAPS